MRRQEILQRLEEVLLERRELIRESLQQELLGLAASEQTQVGDVADAALDSDFDEINSRIAEVESLELAEIETALQRMRDGTYGSCELCGRSIPIKRLEAVPYARLCVGCQREREEAQLTQPFEEHWSLVPAADEEASPTSFADERDLVA